MGIVEDNDELLVDLHLKRVQTLCRTWLLSILQNLVAIAIVLAISWRHDSRDLFLEKAAAGAAIHLATLAFGMVLWRGEARQWPFYRLKQWLVVMGFVIAVATSPLLLIIAQAQ